MNKKSHKAGKKSESEPRLTAIGILESYTMDGVILKCREARGAVRGGGVRKSLIKKDGSVGRVVGEIESTVRKVYDYFYRRHRDLFVNRFRELDPEGFTKFDKSLLPLGFDCSLQELQHGVNVDLEIARLERLIQDLYPITAGAAELKRRRGASRYGKLKKGHKGALRLGLEQICEHFETTAFSDIWEIIKADTRRKYFKDHEILGAFDNMRADSLDIRFDEIVEGDAVNYTIISTHKERCFTARTLRNILAKINRKR